LCEDPGGRDIRADELKGLVPTKYRHPPVPSCVALSRDYSCLVGIAESICANAHASLDCCRMTDYSEVNLPRAALESCCIHRACHSMPNKLSLRALPGYGSLHQWSIKID
jgi:hypothetical protein